MTTVTGTDGETTGAGGTAADHAAGAADGTAADRAVGASEAGGVGEAGAGATAGVAEAVKPLLRGWIHAVMSPLVLAASITLVAVAPTTAARWSMAVFGLTATVMFTTSAIYHRGTWSPRVAAVLRRLDHANIFAIIAGTYTPLAVLLLPTETARLLLVIVWSGAIAGLLTRVFWLGAPRWLYVPIYVALGWVAVWFLPQFWHSGGPAVTTLVFAGGIAYTLGAVVYGLKRPNPSPRWFGFHEVFHLMTVVGYVCHLVAVGLAMFR